MPGVEAMITWAEKSLGLGEPNYIQAWYESRHGNLGGNWPWCDAAVSYWGFKSGNGAMVGEFAYTVSHANWFKSKRVWHPDIAGIRRGDVLFFDWSGSNSIGAIDHVGLVTGTTSGGRVLTIEGNTANVCARRVRYAATIVGYGRPKYSDTSPTSSTAKPYIMWGDVKYMKRNNSVKVVQQALIKQKFSIPAGATGFYGDQTRSAYAAFQRSLGYSGADADGHPGTTSMRTLAQRARFDIRY